MSIVMTLIVTMQIEASYWIVGQAALDCEREYGVFKQALSNSGQYQEVVIAMRPRGQQLVKPPLPGEFGLLAVNQQHAAAEFLSAARDVGSRYATAPIRAQFIGGDLPDDTSILQTASADPNILIIDIGSAAP